MLCHVPALEREGPMNALRLLVVGALLVALAPSAQAQEEVKKVNAKLLVGTWQVSKADKGAPLVVGDTTEFGKDGTNKTIRKRDGKDVVSKGTYKFKDGKLIVTFKSGQNVSENVLTIRDLTDKKLVVAHVEGGKVIEFKRKK
jgi:uncharacterized protein (TIGR03066 family)